MISETKIDNTVSEVQFDVEDIPSKISTYNFGNIFESLSLRLTSEENSASFLKFLVS